LESQEAVRFARAFVRVRLPHHSSGAVSAHSRPVAVKLSDQILKAGTSAPANYEESDDGTGSRDKAAKRKIALRESKEVRLRMRMLRRCDFLTAEHDPVIQESDELVRIVATVIRKADVGN
jgi:four helix bundle protein